MSFKDKITGSELDLSLNGLTDVPVKELAATRKATHLDLSCNLIKTLPNDFASLTHLVKIDLSRNKLIELPHNFGNLVNLQHLELDRNDLRTLPVSFCRLKNLRWLDLKDNPLEPKLQSVAGDCLDPQQVQTCAKKVVAYMQTIESNLEREKQKKLKELREKQAVEKAQIDKELDEQRKLKKMEKERRKAESKARNEETMKQSQENVERESSQSETESKDEVENVVVENQGINLCMWIIVVLCLAVGTTAYFVASSETSHLYKFSKQDVQILAKLFFSEITSRVTNIWKFIIPYIYESRNFVLSHIHDIMLYISQTATNIELFVADFA